MKWFLLRLTFALLAATSVWAAQKPTAKQQQTLAQLLRLFPQSESWARWLKATEAVPPDFDALPSKPFLPDPIRFENGQEVKKEDWPKRRLELLRLFQHFVIGTLPPPPDNVRAADIQSREEAGSQVHLITLEFGPRQQAKLHMELMVPKGRGPFPVFITQDTHRSWALIAVSRGYIGCVYAGADARDDTAAWPALWPQHDWSKLTRRAWAASRCIDYLMALPIVDKAKIALAGHSRNGKTSLIAAAIDPRITAIISSSSGAGGACSYRFFSETQFGEGIELITRAFPDWLHPRLRFFAGRENKLPVDQPELIACIAPRPCLISTALNDAVESVWAVEQTYYSARRAYALLDKPHDLNLRYRSGGHETRAEDIENYLDWLDTVFGRASFAFPDCVIYPTYEMWKSISAEKIDPLTFVTNDLSGLLASSVGTVIQTAEAWREKQPQIRERVLWGLGQAPPFAQTAASSYDEATHLATMLGRTTVPAGLAKRSVNFGNYVAGDLYFPADADKAAKRIPAVIWLHPFSNSQGYAAGNKRGENPYLPLAQLGCAVLAFDQIGHGARLEEIKRFYQRYPRWSVLGKNVEDTLAAVDALEKMDFIDSKRIYLLGYATGAMTALHAAALDERVAGVVSVAGFMPMRLDTLDKGTGGVARWSVWMPLQPRLGAFVGHEAHIPYDYHEVLALMAPRPVLLCTPKVDYQSTLAAVRLCLEEAGKVYDLFAAKPGLQLLELDDYNHFSPETQKVVYERFKVMAGL